MDGQRTRRFRALTRVALAAIVAVNVLAGCSGSDSSTPKSTERPLTFEEASTMAELLYRNYQAGGAQFVVNTLTEVGGAQLQVSGEVDWTTHSGWADVTSDMPDLSVAGIWWNTNAVLERRPSLDTLLTNLGYSANSLIARAPDTQRRIDQVIAIVVGLASEQRDNAQLIMQTDGSAFVRTDTLRGRPVNVLRYGTRNIYWVDAETGDMLRLEATAGENGLPTLVDIVEHHTVTVPTPSSDTVIDAQSILELYQTLPQV